MDNLKPDKHYFTRNQLRDMAIFVGMAKEAVESKPIKIKSLNHALDGIEQTVQAAMNEQNKKERENES